MNLALSIPSTTFTLNLFQGPLGSKFGASRMGAKVADLLTIARSGSEDKWTLKQVQGDELGEWMP